MLENTVLAPRLYSGFRSDRAPVYRTDVRDARARQESLKCPLAKDAACASTP